MQLSTLFRQMNGMDAEIHISQPAAKRW